MEYIIDSNIFIQAHRVHYPLDVAISFWSKLHELIDEGHIVSNDKVGVEISTLDDDLKSWCDLNCGREFFCSTQGDDIMAYYRAIIGWASSSPQFSMVQK